MLPPLIQFFPLLGLLNLADATTTTVLASSAFTAAAYVAAATAATASDLVPSVFRVFDCEDVVAHMKTIYQIYFYISGANYSCIFRRVYKTKEDGFLFCSLLWVCSRICPSINNLPLVYHSYICLNTLQSPILPCDIWLLSCVHPSSATIFLQIQVVFNIYIMVIVTLLETIKPTFFLNLILYISRNRY